jgi:hypothetical protein
VRTQIHFGSLAGGLLGALPFSALQVSIVDTTDCATSHEVSKVGSQLVKYGVAKNAGVSTKEVENFVLEGTDYAGP